MPGRSFEAGNPARNAPTQPAQSVRCRALRVRTFPSQAEDPERESVAVTGRAGRVERGPSGLPAFLENQDEAEPKEP
jgi:hypothetical protein